MSSLETEGASASAKGSLDLRLDVSEVKQDLSEITPQPLGDSQDSDPELDAKASRIVDQLLAIDARNHEGQEQAKVAVEVMGRHLQTEAARRSALLKQPIHELAQHSEDGGPVANALVDLKIQVEELDPNRFDFSSGWFTRLLGKIPGVGTPLKRYFSRYESAQTVIDAIVRSLEQGRDQLKRDNITLAEDQKAMRALTLDLSKQVSLAQLLDQKLEYNLEREIGADDPRRKFIQEEIIFPLRQRILDLQQQLAVNQQGVLSIEIIIRNNKELVRGVNRALDVTISALQVAVTVALATAHQKLVLDKITAINRTTSDLIAGTAAQLRTQGTAIHTQASSANLDINALKSAFADLNTAMDEISRYRQEALPQMAQAILDFDQLAAKGEEAIKRMEDAADARPIIDLNAS